MSIFDIIDNRVLGEFPLSVPTSIVVESTIFNMVPEHMEGKAHPLDSLLGWNQHYFSLQTMIRNFISSAGSKNLTKIMDNDKEVVNVLFEEIDIISEIYRDRGNGCVPVFYFHTHRGFIGNRNTFKRLRKPRGKTLVLESFIQKLSRSMSKDNRITVIDPSFPRVNNKSLITTHYAYELLEYNSFKKLALIESHTGAYKPKELWYTKYSNYSEDPRYSMLPFVEILYYFLGDKYTVSPWKKEIRLRLLDIAEKHKFSPRMSPRVVYGHIRRELLPTIDVRFQ